MSSICFAQELNSFVTTSDLELGAVAALCVSSISLERNLELELKS
jgi:hypothetical protein